MTPPPRVQNNLVTQIFTPFYSFLLLFTPNFTPFINDRVRFNGCEPGFAENNANAMLLNDFRNPDTSSVEKAMVTSFLCVLFHGE